MDTSLPENTVTSKAKSREAIARHLRQHLGSESCSRARAVAFVGAAKHSFRIRERRASLDRQPPNVKKG